MPSKSSGGGALPSLAVDLDYPSTAMTGSAAYKQIAAINASAALTEVLGLSGKFVISFLELVNLTAESITVKLTVDGVVVWNDTFICSTTLRLWNASLGESQRPSFKCESSFSLEVKTTTDTDIGLNYQIAEIL